MGPRRILVIDDNRTAAETLASILRIWGYEVRVEYDGPQGLTAASTFRPHVAIVDIEMPSMDGIEVARRLREQEPKGHSDLVVVSLTGHDLRTLGLGVGRDDFDQHFTKPLNLEAFARFLARQPFGDDGSAAPRPGQDGDGQPRPD
jgi:two-component system CheB/CheR fusion protein